MEALCTPGSQNCACAGVDGLWCEAGLVCIGGVCVVNVMSDASTDTQISIDAATNTYVDAATDVAFDANVDVQIDTAPDTNTHTETDAYIDSATDAGLDAAMDTGIDGASDGNITADTNVDSNTEAGISKSSCPWVDPGELTGGSDLVRGDLIQFNDNGGWCWYQDERAVIDTAQNKLIIGSVASGGSRNSAIEAVIYDMASGQSQRETLHQTADLWMDDHNAPALVVLPNGDYLAMYAGHNHTNNYNSYYRIYSNGSWSQERIFNWQQEGGANYTTTYSNLWNMTAEGKVYNIARSHDRAPNIMTSDDNGQTWSYGGVLATSVTAGYVSGYFKYWGNGVDRIDFICTEQHPRNYTTSIYHGYIQGGKSYNSFGQEMDGNIFEKYNVPLGEQFTRVVQNGVMLGGARLVRLWNIDLMRYEDGVIVALLTSRANDNDTDHRYIYARFDGVTWKATYLGKGGDKLYSSEEDYVGLGTLDPDDPNVLYLSTPFDPRDDSPTNKREIYRGVTCDDGATFNWSAITANSTLDNLRPIVPKWDTENTALIWFKGTYISAQSIDASIVGIITQPE